MLDFLLEIGLEEVPARMISAASAELERRVIAMLERHRLLRSAVQAQSFATPRRLAVLVPGIAERQQDISDQILGPAIGIAFKDGVPGPAAAAFARKAGVSVEALRSVTTPKGDYLAATVVKPGLDARQVILEELPKELAGIYWPKTMHWRAGKPERFVRPVRWILALLGEDVVPVSFAGCQSGKVTFGHRILYPERNLPVASPAQYQRLLSNAFVMAHVEDRRQFIRKELDRVCRTLPGMRWREDHALVDKLTHLTEWPSVILGRFDEAYLQLPQEVLVTVMRDHQGYFAVEDETGSLAPYFLAVLNTQPDELGQNVIRHGNERVLRARFNDARFFWNFDQRTPLEGRVESLTNLTFHKELGSYAAKTSRIRGLTSQFAALVNAGHGHVDVAALDTAARLAKTDLTTELVKEFTELQGIVGGLYASSQGASEKSATAIYDHYRPTSMEDYVPRTAEGALLAIADKADTIAGMFGLGQQPTGSKDPFALRRAANGIVKILAETDLPLTLGEIAFRAAAGSPAVTSTMELFFAERLEFYLREVRQQAYDVVKAVLAAAADDVRDALARSLAVSAVRGSADFTAVAGAFKRMKNILAQATERGLTANRAVDRLLLTDAAEIALERKSADIAAGVAELRETHEYTSALEAIAGLRPQVDAFFETVMVMAPNATVRANRLALLERVLHDFSGIADFSEIVING